MPNDIIQIPTVSTPPAYEEAVDLQGVAYRPTFRLNERMNRWFMDLRDSAGAEILVGVPILGGLPLTFRFAGRHEGVPPGSIAVIDETGANGSPEAEDLGDEFNLVYQESV